MRFRTLLPLLTAFMMGSTTTIVVVQAKKRLRGAMIGRSFDLNKSYYDFADEADKEANVRRLMKHIITGREAPRGKRTGLTSLMEGGSISNIDTTIAQVKQKLATRTSTKKVAGVSGSSASPIVTTTATTTTTPVTTTTTPVTTTTTTTTSSVETEADNATTMTMTSSEIGPPPGEGKSSQEEEAAFDSILFYHLAPVKAVSPRYGDTAFEQIGSVFLYHGRLYDAAGEVIPGTRIAGECTKTQVRNETILDERNKTLVGGGLCHFTYTLETSTDGSSKITMNAAGQVYDIVGGNLSITGGTNELRGASGEVSIKPFYNSTAEFDFFTHAVVYEVNATIY